MSSITLQYPPDSFLGRYDAGDHIIDRKTFFKMLSDTAGRTEDFTPEQLEAYVDREFAYADVDKDGVLSRDEFEIYYWSKLKYLDEDSGPNSGEPSPDLFVYFVAYASRGSVVRIERIGLTAFLRMCRACGLLDPPKVNEAIIDLVFYEAWRKTTNITLDGPGVFPGGNRYELKLDFFQFLVALVLLAGKLDEHLRYVIHKILSSPAPSVAWSPGEVLPQFKINLNDLGGGGDEKKPTRKKNPEYDNAGQPMTQGAPPVKGGKSSEDAQHARRLEWELQRLHEDLRQLERDLESEKFARMDENRANRLMIDTLKSQLASERARREEIELLKTAQIDALRKELAQALQRLEDSERGRREDARKAKQALCDLQDQHDREDERRREELRALRSEVEQERTLRLEEVGMYREELARVRAELDAERARFEGELRERLETIVRLRAELESAHRFRTDVEREKMAELADLRAKFEIERREWEAKLRGKEDEIRLLREARDREAARVMELEKKRHDDLLKTKQMYEAEKARREAAELRAQALEDRLKRELGVERANRESDAKAFRVKVEKLEAELEALRRMQGGEETKWRDQVYALQKELEKERIRRETDERTRGEELNRVKLALEQERAARLKAESETQDLRAQLRVSESERIRIKVEWESVQGQMGSKDRRIKELEDLLQKLISEYQALLQNDMNLSKIMGSLQSSLAEHGEKLGQRTSSQLDSLLQMVGGANAATGGTGGESLRTATTKSFRGSVTVTGSSFRK